MSTGEALRVPEVSVVIPAYNAADVIVEQLESLARQTDAPVFEVVVADNGSTDATVRRVLDFDAPFELQVVDASRRPGASHARNAGALAARGAFLAFCDSDDYVEPDWLAQLLRARDARPGAIIAGGHRHYRLNDVDVLDAYTIDPRFRVPRSTEQPEPLVAEQHPFSGYLPSAQGNNFAIDRTAYLELDGMDSSYPGGSEETDFVWRAQEAGMPLIAAPNAIVHYRLRHSPRAIFRQQRTQQFAKVLLWMRFRERGMQGPSWKFSLLAVAKLLVRAPGLSRTRRGRLHLARWLGGHIGAILGMVEYRVRGRVPARILIDRVDRSAHADAVERGD